MVNVITFYFLPFTSALPLELKLYKNHYSNSNSNLAEIKKGKINYIEKKELYIIKKIDSASVPFKLVSGA